MTAIDQVHKGMRVVDGRGAELGTVELVKLGDPRQVTATGAGAPPSDILDAVLGRGPNAPEPLRSRLLRHGYIQVDGPGLSDSDRYVRADLIERVEDGIVRLAADEDRAVGEY